MRLEDWRPAGPHRQEVLAVGGYSLFGHTPTQKEVDTESKSDGDEGASWLQRRLPACFLTISMYWASALEWFS